MIEIFQNTNNTIIRQWCTQRKSIKSADADDDVERVFKHYSSISIDDEEGGKIVESKHIIERQGGDDMIALI